MQNFVNELTVRTVGPALVFVIELEAPVRMSTLASTDSEFERLKHWTLDDANAAAVCSAFFEHEDLSETDRADEHVQRLATAVPLALGERVA